MTRYFKVLDANGRSCNGGDMQWHLPKGKHPGKWMPPIEGDLRPCRNGYHLCREQDLLGWIGPMVWEAEVGDEVIVEHNKVVVREARLIRATHWNDHNARLFACWCAEQVLENFESVFPDDSRVRDAIDTARKLANGDLPPEAAEAAEAARSAARSAAARSAAARSEAARSEAEAARSAARSEAAAEAARSAAEAAAWSAAAEAAEAARSAWSAAAWSARSAWSAAARSAAAWSAARSAAEAAQTKALIHLLDTGELPS